MSEIRSTIIDSRFFDGGQENVSVTSVDVPGITQSTVDISGAGVMGTVSMPVTGRIESMECVVHTRGMDADNDRLSIPGIHKLEMRYLQDSYSPATAKMAQNSVKLFIDGVYKSSEGGSLEPGSVVEGSYTYEVIRMQKFVDGRETLLFDKILKIYRVNGVDYWETIRNLLK